LEEESRSPEFWGFPQSAQKKMQRLEAVKDQVRFWEDAEEE